MHRRIVVLPLRHTVAWRIVAFVVFDATAVYAFVLDAFEITLVQLDVGAAVLAPAGDAAHAAFANALVASAALAGRVRRRARCERRARQTRRGRRRPHPARDHRGGRARHWPAAVVSIPAGTYGVAISAAGGLDKVARLVRVEGDVLHFEQRVGPGTMAFVLRKSEIESLSEPR